MNKISKHVRILGVVLSTRGFGYAVLEDENKLHDFGRSRIYGDKNAATLAGIQKVITRNRPDLLVLQDVSKAKGTNRIPRIKELNRKIVALAKKQNIRIVKISGRELRARLLGNEDGTKYEMAILMAQRFPEETGFAFASKAQIVENEDPRMDFFEAVGLAVAFQRNR